MTESNSPSPFREAMSFTTQAIEMRMKWFRNLIIGVVVVALSSLILAFIQFSFRPLWGLVLLVPLCGVFLYLDSRIVNLWQERILQMWVQGDLDLTIFYNSMSTIRMFPHRMFQGMLKTLLINNQSIDSRNLNQEVKKSLVHTIQTISRCQNNKIVFFSLAYTFALISMAMAEMLKSWLPLFGLLLVPLLLGMNNWSNSLKLRHLRRHFLEMNRQEKEKFKYFFEAASQLDWGSILEKKKVQLLSI
jgi:hypothetical protein